MATDAAVLKQFLVSVGFQIDDNAFRRFVDGMRRVDNTAMLVGKTVASVAVAAEAMVHVFSYQMEKLYYASQRTKASVQNIQALEYGARQIGISADTARQSLESMAASIRMNPGLRGLLDSILGRNTEGEDQAKVMLDLVKELGKMPHMVGAQFAQMFGMDEQTFLMMVQKGPELAAAMEKRNELLRRSGVDAQEAAAAGREYMNAWREIMERLEIFTQKLSVDFLPTFQKLVTIANQGLDALSKWKFDLTSVTEFARLINDILVHYKQLNDTMMGSKDPLAGVRELIKANLLALLEFVDSMLLVMQGRWSEAGTKLGSAAKHFFMPPGNTSPRKEGELKPISRGQAATGGLTVGQIENPEMYEWNLAQLREALAHQKDAAGRAILQGELSRIMSPANGGYAPTGVVASSAGASGAGTNVNLNMKTDIHVQGSGDSMATAKNVVGAQRQVGSEICRNLEGCVR